MTSSHEDEASHPVVEARGGDRIDWDHTLPYAPLRLQSQPMENGLPEGTSLPDDAA